jgi:hypothetical protein
LAVKKAVVGDDRIATAATKRGRVTSRPLVTVFAEQVITVHVGTDRSFKMNVREARELVASVRKILAAK